jgi:SAM-dependent methyltransferase
MDKSASRPEQRISGLYGLVTLPWFYEGFQNLLGATRARHRFFSEWVETDATKDVLDIGCGPGVALSHIAWHSYVGIDLNPDHIAHAEARGAPDAVFKVGAAQDVVPTLDQNFDVMLALGFLHHLSDESVRGLLDAALARLRPGGSAFFLEPVYVQGQHPIARKMKDLDSGQHIRTPEAYTALMSRPGYRLSSRISDDLLRIPYNHFWGRLARDA